MKAELIRNLSTKIDGSVVIDLVDSYERVISEYRKGNPESCLNHAGKFVEHALRAIVGLRCGTYPSEIKSFSATVKELEKDSSFPESLRLLIPRISSALIFDVRSKRGAAHVKEISPSLIDATLATQGASWILAEFLRLFHSGNDEEVAKAMNSLMRREIPFIEQFSDEFVVTQVVKSDVEILLQLTRSEPEGLNRKSLGECIKQSPSVVTLTLQSLQKKRFIYKTKSGFFRITGPGESHLGSSLAQSALHLPA